MRIGRLFAFSLITMFAACGNDAVATASLTQLDLQSVPAELQPGSLIALRPLFRAGTGRIDPDVGPVESGKAYVVGPFAASRTYTLTVTDGPNVSAKQLVVPFRYREQVTELDASTIARSEHAAQLLPDGTVLIVGGRSTGVEANATAERYDPSLFDFAPVGNQSVGRRDPAVVVETQLADGSMTAVSFGGAAQETIPGIGTVVERWNSTQQAWSNLGNLSANRTKHTATQLEDGRTLVLGGEASGSDPARLAGEIWTDAVGSRAPLAPIVTHRIGHTATKLEDGSLLVIGGVDAATGQPLASAERFDPVTEAMVPAGTLAAARSQHAALRLSDGRVLVVGGTDGIAALRACEIWDPVTGLFASAGDLVQAVYEARAVLLGSGEALVVGGQTAPRGASSVMQAWSAATNEFRVFGQGLPAPRSGHSLTLQRDGRVLLLGGDAGADFPTPAAWIID
jgi:hypothetical protein